MNPVAQLTEAQRQAVEEFRLRHRTGVLTLLFTDVVGSSAFKRELGDSAGTALIEKHQEIVRELLASFPEAEEISTAGDSFFIVFIRPSDAVRFTLQLHSRLRSLSGPGEVAMAVRAGLHMGEVFIERTEDASRVRDILGIQVDLAHSIMELATGGQTLMSRSVFDNARAILGGEAIADLHLLSWLNHGPYRLKGFEEPFDVCEVGEETFSPLTPPPDTEDARRFVTADAEPVLGWRPAVEQIVPGTEWVLQRKLGAGGFGEVWLATHKTMREHRVFKFCFRADRVRSLKREATLFRVLKEKVGEHPNIVRIHDVYFTEPPYYIETEFVEGKNLAEWCEARGGPGAIAPETRLAIVAQVADALQAAHDSGIIHRDVKPSNILISGEGAAPDEIHVKLADFGIGQVVSRDALGGDAVTGLTETLAGTELASRSGTRIYMAPEVVAGRRSTSSSDVYSLGVVLYQLTVGDLSRPLTVDWRDNVDDHVLAEDLVRCFAGDPAARFDNAAELAESLRSIEDRRVSFEREEACRPPPIAAWQDATLSRTALVGAILAAFCILWLGVLMVGMFTLSGDQVQVQGTPSTGAVREGYAEGRAAKSAEDDRTGRRFSWIQGASLMSFVLTLVGLIIATLLGVMATLQILSSYGRIYGLGLALFDTLLLPLLLLDCVIFGLFGILISVLQIRSLGFPDLMLFAISTSVVVDFLLVRAVWRYFNKRLGFEPAARGDLPDDLRRRYKHHGILALSVSLAGVVTALIVRNSGTAAQTYQPMLRIWFLSQIVALPMAYHARRHAWGKAAIALVSVLLVIVLFFFFGSP